MSYMKATAEVVMLDVQDVVRTSVSQTAINDVLAGLSTEARAILEGGFSNPAGVGAGLKNLLDDMGDDEAAYELLALLGSEDTATEQATAFVTATAAFLGDLFCPNAANSTRYGNDDEDDSFDSEW